jgi:DNA-binding PadR family transcriptional regulator
MKIKILFATLLTLAPIVLAILAEEDHYGYAILQRVQEF